ncbi:PVC-type heme-binding CxxCH protein [Fodinibius sediminis]|nr:PVC-type heme-binding CxxCH protein [Fodinibius sediminis]
MHHSNLFQRLLSRINTGLLPALFLLILAGCSGKEPPKKEINTLKPQKAAEIAANIEKEVPVELAEGVELNLWASEELIIDPVGLDIDNKGRLFVTNTTRSWSSEFDIRDHRNWMDEAMTWSTVEDRRDFLHRELSPERSENNKDWLPDRNEDGSHDWKDLTVQKEKVYRVEDLNDDGVADQSQLFIEDFHSEVTDVAGAILSFQDNVYVGVAPDMWRLRDTNDDGMADEKETISHGYGVHIGFSGHGMSGATYGPDGRIYWGIGDIGFNGKGPNGKHWKYPNRGIIARSDPDGSNFEIFAMGVRNTFEFSFDKYGNLVSVDNDGDHPGESERLVYLVKGSDTGWRHNWQFGKYDDPNNNDYKVWMDEKMYKPRHEGQAAYFIPPIANYHNGPAGMAYNPGTALSEQWKDHFFVAEYTGSTASSRIHAFTLEQNGAGFDLKTDEVVEQGILATGLDFGPDGALYFADWIEGWKTKNKGRIWKLDTPETADAQIRQETKQILAEDFSSHSGKELAGLLGHQDMRVRMKAQFELAERGNAGASVLKEAIETGEQLARLHGIWGIGQLARTNADHAEALIGLLGDDDPEVRAQAAKVLGDVQYAPAARQLVTLLEDEEARPRFFAAQALGEIGYQQATEPIIAMLEANNDEDVYLRHAGTLALAQIGNADAITALENSPSRALRIAAVVALRRMEHPGVARFLDDEDEYIVTEAARAINDDWSINEALPDLALLLDETSFSNDALIRRAINANLRTGGAEATERLANYAVRQEAPDSMRIEAVATLGVWSNPPQLDRVTGRYRGKPELNPEHARDALAMIVDPLLNAQSAPIRVAAIQAISNLNYRDAIDRLFAHLQDDTSPRVRVAALKGLETMDFSQIEEAIQTALSDQDEQVRMTALAMAPTLDLTDQQITDLLSSVLGEGAPSEQQVVLETLGEMHSAPANDLIAQELTKLSEGNYPPELQLDLIMAAKSNNSEELARQLKKYEASTSSDDVVASNRELLYGGNAENGRQLLFRHEAAQCMRCHAVGGNGGTVGPDLADIGSTLNREQMLEALLDPGARIAPGFGTVTVTLKDGEQLSGIVQEETEDMLTLQSADGTTRKIEKNTIKEQRTAPSSMPPMGTILEKDQIRDMIEFLSTLKKRNE